MRYLVHEAVGYPSNALFAAQQWLVRKKVCVFFSRCVFNSRRLVSKSVFFSCLSSFLCCLTVFSADWAMRWIGSDATFAERLIAFAAVEVSKENNHTAYSVGPCVGGSVGFRCVSAPCLSCVVRGVPVGWLYDSVAVTSSLCRPRCRLRWLWLYVWLKRL